MPNTNIKARRIERSKNKQRSNRENNRPRQAEGNTQKDENEDRPRQAEGNFIKLSPLTDNSQVRQNVSVAIDFGTSNCAVGYSAHSKQDDIFIVNDWHDGEKHGKIPTAILFNEREEFVAFGNLALKMYRDLKEDEEDEKFYFFQKFKMQLYDEKVFSISPSI